MASKWVEKLALSYIFVQCVSWCNCFGGHLDNINQTNNLQAFEVRIFPVRIYSVNVLVYVNMKMTVATFVCNNKTLGTPGKTSTQWKMYEYKFGCIKQRFESGSVKHSATRRISNEDILLFWARRQWAIFLTSDGRENAKC